MTKPKYEFDDAFQTKVAALATRDVTFALRTEGLIESAYFADQSEAYLVALALSYFNRYKAIPSNVVFDRLVSQAVKAKKIRSDEASDVIDRLNVLRKTDLSDRDYVIDEVASFAKHQAIMVAFEASIKYMDDHDFAEVESRLTAAFQVGANDLSVAHDLKDDLAARTQRRKDIASGKLPVGISTGYVRLDNALAGGLKRKELTVLMGPAKAGKSFGLMNIGVNVVKAGKNVLYITLENSIEVTTDRIDAFLSETKTDEILKRSITVGSAVELALDSAGVMKIHEYGTGTFAPKDLRRLIEQYRARGIIFDLVVVDYWDIMAPDMTYRDNAIRESASIGMGLRAIAKDENLAMFTAIQSNREGAKAAVAKMEHAAEDFNKVRLADALFSINRMKKSKKDDDDDEEALSDEAVLYMAAVRNAPSGYSIGITQDLARATFIKKFHKTGT